MAPFGFCRSIQPTLYDAWVLAFWTLPGFLLAQSPFLPPPGSPQGLRSWSTRWAKEKDGRSAQRNGDTGGATCHKAKEVPAAAPSRAIGRISGVCSFPLRHAICDLDIRRALKRLINDTISFCESYQCGELLWCGVRVQIEVQSDFLESNRSIF